MFKFMIEFIGTFILLYIILESYSHKLKNIRPFIVAVGVVITTILFGSISGAHLNPAVTTMMYAKGDKNVSGMSDVVGYIIAQILGGICAYKLHAILNNVPTI